MNLNEKAMRIFQALHGLDKPFWEVAGPFTLASSIISGITLTEREIKATVETVAGPRRCLCVVWEVTRAEYESDSDEYHNFNEAFLHFQMETQLALLKSWEKALLEHQQDSCDFGV